MKKRLFWGEVPDYANKNCVKNERRDEMNKHGFKRLAIVALFVLIVGAMLIAPSGAPNARDRGFNQPGAAGNAGRDPGINQPGPAGNEGRDPGVNQPGAAGNTGRDPGINQPGAAGNRKGPRR